LFIHSQRGNVSTHSDVIRELLQHYSTVYVLEPRGYGIHTQLDDDPAFAHKRFRTASIASSLIAIKKAIEWMSFSTLPFDIVALHMGANMTRFVVKVFAITSMFQCIYIHPFSIDALNQRLPWTRSCATGAVMEWSTLRQPPKRCASCHE
jgi:hypothetical protein